MQNSISLLELHNSVSLRLKEEEKTFVSLSYQVCGVFVLTFQDKEGNLHETQSDKNDLERVLSDLFVCPI